MLEYGSSRLVNLGVRPRAAVGTEAETTLSAENVSRLELKWKTKLSTVPNETVLSTLTAPLVVHDVMTAQGLKTLVFLVGSDDEVFALDGTSGRIIWQKAFARSLSRGSRQLGYVQTLKTRHPSSTERRRQCILFLRQWQTSRPKYFKRARALSSHRIHYALREGSKSHRSLDLHERTRLRWDRIERRRDGLDRSLPRDGDAFFTPAREESAGAWGRGGIVKGLVLSTSRPPTGHTHRC